MIKNIIVFIFLLSVFALGLTAAGGQAVKDNNGSDVANVCGRLH